MSLHPVELSLITYSICNRLRSCEGALLLSAPDLNTLDVDYYDRSRRHRLDLIILDYMY